MKDLVRSMVISIGMAMAIFCFVGMVFDIRNGGNFSLSNYSFTKMAVGSVLVGLGFGVPTAVYKKDNLPMPVRVVIHMGIGCVVYTAVAYAVGWIGGANAAQEIIILCIMFAAAFAIWFLFMCYYRKEAKKLNDRIQGMK